MTTLELYGYNSEAYDALPDPYREDDCLEFFEIDGCLMCQPAEGQEVILGDWVAIFTGERWKQYA